LTESIRPRLSFHVGLYAHGWEVYAVRHFDLVRDETGEVAMSGACCPEEAGGVVVTPGEDFFEGVRSLAEGITNPSVSSAEVWSAINPDVIAICDMAKAVSDRVSLLNGEPC